MISEDRSMEHTLSIPSTSETVKTRHTFPTAPSPTTTHLMVCISLIRFYCESWQRNTIRQRKDKSQNHAQTIRPNTHYRMSPSCPPLPLQHDNHAAAEAVRNGHPSFGGKGFAMNSPGESRERKTGLWRGCVATSSIATERAGF